ncbi:MAG TPA: MraY family glycosyltransferase [Mycobacteriales bacterium]|nr:MraY family glycosyltransferase [Mycobacteriales bacterium]
MREYALTLVVVAGVTYVMTPLVRRLAVALGALARVRDRDVHTIPTPKLGGIAMYAGIAAGLLVASRLPTLQRVFISSATRGVLFGGALLVVLGALDDRYELDALTKLAGQILAAGIMVLQGVQLLFLPFPHFELSLSPDVGVPATVLLVVLTINAVNFLDGLDGLAAGIVCIASLAFFAYSYQLSVVHHFDRATAPTLLTAVCAGACVGFLPHNFNPARVFMGDSGSMLLGLMLAASTISLTGQLDANAVQNSDVFPALLPLLVPLAVLAVPLVDLLLAVIRRTRSGRAPWAPDKAHLHHRLLEIGHTQTRAVLIMYFWSALLAGTAVAVSITHGTVPVLAVAGSLAVLLVLVSSRPRWWARRAAAVRR